MGTKPIKKEFITYWNQEKIYINFNEMNLNQLNFFDSTIESMDSKRYEAILPLDLPFNELAVFTGKKTKITIEVIP